MNNLQQLQNLLAQNPAILAQLTAVAKNETTDTWESKLKVDKEGNPKTLANNYLLWLQNGSDRYTGKIRYNGFFDFIEYNGELIQDYEESYMNIDAEEYFQKSVNKGNLKDAFIRYAYDNAYNPITEYLNSLKGKWDGEKRLETFIIKCLDADDNELNRFFTKTWMIAAVKRAYEPGCQFDCVLTLQGGAQGSGKTTLFRRLTMNKYYHTFAKGEFSNKDSIDKMNKSWVALLDEFDKFSPTEVADLKSKITEQVMACRKSYGHNTQDYKVHWVYAATTNTDDFLCDLSGDEFERRYWIIECKKTTVDSRVADIMTDEYVKQLWAEAVHYYFENPTQPLFLGSDNALFQIYKDYQLKFKKTSKNDTQIYLKEILDRKYLVDKDGYFTDTLDMRNQFVGLSSSLDINKYNDCATYLNKVPCAYVTHILEHVYKVKVRPKVIKSLLLQMGDEWVIKHAKYHKKTASNIICRKRPIGVIINKYDDNEEIPF